MKRTFRQWAGALALGLCTLGGALLSTAANAAPIQTVSNGGITCSQYSSGYGTFPTTVWDCITPATNGSNAQLMADTVFTLPASVKGVLSARSTQLYLFTNNTAFNSFSGGAAGASALGTTKLGAPGAPAVNMAAIFTTATIQGTVTPLTTSFYKGNIRQQVGQIYALNAPAGLKSTDPFFSAAVADDSVYLSNNTGVDKPNYPSSATVWGATIAGLPANVGKSPWEILGLRYGSTKTFIYGFQIGRQIATPTVPDLNTVLQSYMSTTRNWSAQQVFAVGAQPYVVTNGILCVEQNGYNNFPLKWNACVRPYTPTANAQVVLSQPHNLSAAWQTLLQNAGVKVYVFRDIDSFVAFDGRSPASTVNVLGFSTHTGVIRSATFQDAFQAAGPIVDVSPWTGGTIMHELGHQFDNVIWAHISTANSAAVLGSVRWTNAMATDKTAFNTGTCAAKVDADRLAQVPALPAICTLPANAGKSNWDVLATVLPMDSQEVWARTFARRAGGSMLPYYNAVQDRVSSSMLTYINDLWSTGAPHN